VYVCRLQEGESCTVVQGFLGSGRSVQDDVNSSVGDLSRSYRWSAAYLWAEKVSKYLLRFGFLICMVIGG
jgi:hypothetical protein